MKFKENRKRIEKKLKSVTNFVWETTSGKAVLQISFNNKRRETESRIVESVVIPTPHDWTSAILSLSLSLSLSVCEIISSLDPL